MSDTGALRKTCHPACIACGDAEHGGFGLIFAEQADGSVEAAFGCDAIYQGFPDRLHGGVVALLLDSAMMHCMFARGICGVTAKLEVKFRHPVAVGRPATIRARLVGESPSVCELEAEIHQADRCCASAQGMFARQPAVESSGGCGS
ncbi:MAG: PaaI family thioesterase [Phycisphaerae bacterium]|nr:PaaI family thioesterase [Phycisphaerae bacterium]